MYLVDRVAVGGEVRVVVANRVEAQLDLQEWSQESDLRTTTSQKCVVVPRRAREAGPPNHHDDKVDSDQQVVNKELSLSVSGCRRPSTGTA